MKLSEIRSKHYWYREANSNQPVGMKGGGSLHHLLPRSGLELLSVDPEPEEHQQSRLDSTNTEWLDNHSKECKYPKIHLSSEQWHKIS